MIVYKNLSQYLKEVSHKPFEWFRHDCLVFTNDAWRAMHGRGYADDWIGVYRDDSGGLVDRDVLRAVMGFRTLQDAISDRLLPVHGVPPRGALVAFRPTGRASGGARTPGLYSPYAHVALGICVGSKAAFVSARGLVYLSVEDICAGWIEP